MGTQTESSPLRVEVMLSAQSLVFSGELKQTVEQGASSRGASNGCDTRAVLQIISKPLIRTG